MNLLAGGVSFKLAGLYLPVVEFDIPCTIVLILFPEY